MPKTRRDLRPPGDTWERYGLTDNMLRMVLSDYIDKVCNIVHTRKMLPATLWRDSYHFRVLVKSIRELALYFGELDNVKNILPWLMAC